MDRFEALIVTGRVLDALRLFFSDEREAAVSEFLSVACDEPHLKAICLLLALDFAERECSDHALFLLARSLGENGHREDSELVRALTRKSSAQFESAVDSVVSGARLSESTRSAILTELMTEEPLDLTEIQAREKLVRQIKERLHGK